MQRFRQSRVFTWCGAVVVPLVLLAAVTVAFSADRAPIASKTPSCSVETLEGDYRGNLSGVRSTGLFALQFRDTFNGDGTGTGSTTLMTETSGPTSTTTTLSYTLDSDCTGTLTVMRSDGSAAHYNIVVVKHATEIDYLGTDSGVVATGTGRK